MAIKQGSVMEGIFAMYCAGVLVDPNHGADSNDVENFINELRVDTTLGKLADKKKKSVDYFNTFPVNRDQRPSRRFKGVNVLNGGKAKQLLKGTEKYSKLEPLLNNSDEYFETINVKGIQDYSQVKLKVRVKEAETGAIYGTNLVKLRKLVEAESKKSLKEYKGDLKNYVEIKKKMLTLIESKETSFFKQLKKKKTDYIKNSESDVIIWTVDADGIAGETSGGEIKQDVTIDIKANGKNLLHQTLNFSLKSDSVSIHGGGLYKGVPDVYEMFQGFISASEIQSTKTWLNKIEDEASDEVSRKDAINALWMFLGSKLPTTSSTPDYSLSERLWDILEKRLFGTGYKGDIQVLEMKKNEIREITKDNFARLRNSGIKLSPLWVPSKGDAATPGQIFIVPTYPNRDKAEVVEKKIGGTGDKSIFKMRISYLFSKPPGSKDRTGPAYPNKMFIELGGAASIVHDENYIKFVNEKLIG